MFLVLFMFLSKIWKKNKNKKAEHISLEIFVHIPKYNTQALDIEPSGK